MKRELEYLEQSDGLKATNYSNINTQLMNNINSPTESTALDNIKKMDKLQGKINKTELKLEIIDNALSGLNEREILIITERYINCRQWWEVAQKASYSEEQCRNIKRQAMKKLIIGIYGID